MFRSRLCKKAPLATYRLQFNSQFTLKDAVKLIPYLHNLGVSHVYASPLTKAVPGSSHGYDVCDYNQLNPEIGTEEDLAKLSFELKKHGMGIILDFVPNHMGIASPENKWWWDVLQNGQKSRYASFFDIDWELGEGKLLFPILHDAVEALIANGEISISHYNHKPTIYYDGRHFPISRSCIGKNIAEVVFEQNYVLSKSQEGRCVNYRRYLDIDTLARFRVESKKVFTASHKLLSRLYKRRLIDGVRIDHPDGLWDPGEYATRLRSMMPGAWILFENVTIGGQKIPESWPVDGMTGYDFLNLSDALFRSGEQKKDLFKLYS